MDPAAVPPSFLTSFWLVYVVVRLALGALILPINLWLTFDCAREGREFYWYWLIWGFPGVGALVYFVNYKASGASADLGLFKYQRQRQLIRDLQAKIHHLDTAYHHAELGDVYLRLRKYDEARACYEASLARDPSPFEVPVHLGFALLGLGRPEEAWVRLEPALAEKPEFEYGELLWQGARCLIALGRLDEARELFRRLAARFTYAQAMVEYAELLGRLGALDEGRAILDRVVADAPHAPRFQQVRDRKWVRRARRALRSWGRASAQKG